MAKAQQEEVTDDDLNAAQGVQEELDDDAPLDMGTGDPRPASEAAWFGPANPAMPVPPSKPLPLPEVGAGETFLNRAANNVPLGRLLTDLGAAGQMKVAPMLGRMLPDSLARSLPGVLPEPGAKLTPEAVQALLAMGTAEEKRNEPSALDTYRGMRDNRAARTQIGSEQNPIAGTAGAATGFGLSVLAPIPSAKVGTGWTGRLASGALNGSIAGAIGGATDGQADLANGDVLGTLGDAAIGGAAGAALGGAVGLVADPAARFVRSLYKGIVTPTKAAQYLRGKGVDLTTGQMNPGSVLGQMEEVSTSVGGVGPSIIGQREAARKSWQDAVMNEALPPGMSPPDPTLPVDERLAAMYDGFVPAYAPAKGVQVVPQTSSGVPLIPPPPIAPALGAAPPVGPLSRAPNGRWLPGMRPPATPAANAVPSIFSQAVDDPNVLASAGDRDEVRAYLQNQLTIATQNANGGKVSSDALLEMRHNIRRELNQALKEQSFKQARLLKNAEAQLTDVLETSLPNDAFDALKAADAQYARYKPLESAVAAAGDQPNGFSPTQLANAIKSGMGDKGAYARGAGGEMRELASAGKQVFDVRSPPTGARIMGMGPLQWVGAPMSFAANLKPVQKALLGEYAGQKAMGAVDSAVSGAMNRFPYEQAGAQALDSLGMSNTPQNRASSPEGQRFFRQVTTSPTAFGPYSARLQQAASNGPEALSMQDYLLASDPAYVEMRRKAAQTDGGERVGAE